MKASFELITKKQSSPWDFSLRNVNKVFKHEPTMPLYLPSSRYIDNNVDINTMYRLIMYIF